MIETECALIQKELEREFDVPFSVNIEQNIEETRYKIAPTSDIQELFDVSIIIRQNIRLIIEITPQKFSADMISSMQKSSEEMRANFFRYIDVFTRKGMKIDFSLNGEKCDLNDDEIWGREWKSFRIRCTQIIVDEISRNRSELIIEWSAVTVGMMLSLLNIEAVIETEPDGKQYSEGKVSQVLETKYERNPVNRQLCLAANGYKCKICGFDFEKVYGSLGHHFIHVHHIQMVSSVGHEYFLDPEKDLIPVCPNCHAMLHRENPPLLPKELMNILQNNKSCEEI